MHTLKSVRKTKGYTQKQVAKVTGISNVTISLIETGKHYPGAKTRHKIEQALNCKIDWLQSGAVKLRDPNFNSAEGLAKKLIETTLIMTNDDKTRIKKMIVNYM
jgi:transcriptional regulator with XRE-family HTH domain